MSILKKNTLALAIVAAAGFSANAFAFNIWTGTSNDQNPVRVATADIAAATTIVNSNEDIGIEVTTDSLILGRTTGMTLRLDLDNGARFAQNLVIGTNVTAAGGTGALPAGWTVTISAGGTAGDNFVIFNFNPPNLAPPAVVPGLNLGNLVVIEGAAAYSVINPPAVPAAGTGAAFRGLTALQAANQTVSMTAVFRDPNTAQPIMTSKITPVLRSGNPVAQSCDTTGRFQPAERIDVGSITLPPVPAGSGTRQGFSSDATIGTPINNATRNFIYNAGRVRHQIATDFAATFTYQAGDTFTTSITMPAGLGVGGAFASDTGRGVFLASDNQCANIVTATRATVGNTVTLTYTGAAANTALGLLAAPTTITNGFDLFVCHIVPANNSITIDPSTISGTSTHTRGTSLTPAHDACTLAPLQTNGSTVNIANLPPAGNATQEGLVRIVNNSITSGRVTIRGRDDSGALAPAVTLTLPAGRSVVYTSAELESGTVVAATPTKPALSNGLGDGAGRWRLNIVGEFDNMQVQAYARNVNNDALSNITDFESNQEQADERKNQNFD